jgi:hypothetical protein
MEALLLITLIFTIAQFCEKSDHHKIKKLPPFTKKEAEWYYYNELTKPKK